jgi:hypothetical protein
MVPALKDTIAAQLLTEDVALFIILFAPPLLDSGEHDLMHIGSSIASILTTSGVMENTRNDSVKSAVDIDILIIPA